MRQSPSLSRLLITTTLAAALAATLPARRAEAQPGSTHAELQAVRIDTGPIDNLDNQTKTVSTEIITLPGARWTRLLFDALELEGDSFLLITSLTDGEVQKLDARAAKDWNLTSAFFNGGAVQIELVAAPHTTNRVAMSRALGGAGGDQQPPVLVDRTVCTTTDPRTPSADNRTARLLVINLPIPPCPSNLPCNAAVPLAVCTGFITDRVLGDDAANRVMLSAGHCFDAPGGAVCGVAQFESIALSSASCAITHPPVAQQFPIHTSRWRNENLGASTGHDWAAFICLRNNLNQTVFTRAGGGAAFQLAAAAPALGTAVTKFGYGSQGRQNNTVGTGGNFCGCVAGDTFATFNSTQQTSAGVTTSALINDTIRHNSGTCGGDSGAPLIDNLGRVAGIHVGGGCNPLPSPPNNVATNVLAAHVAAGIVAVQGAAGPINNACVNAITVGTGSTVPFNTTGATTDGPTETACAADGNLVRNDIWYRFVATANNTYFATCGSEFDTRMAIYAACPNGVNQALACNDNSNNCATGSVHSQITLATTPGVAYLIRIGGLAGATGRGVLSIDVAGPPPNDLCTLVSNNAANATDGYNFVNTIASTVTGANAAVLCPNARLFNHDVWFRYTATRAGMVRAEMCSGNTWDPILAVYNSTAGTCPQGALITCNDDTCGLGPTLTWTAAAGTTYLLRVGSVGPTAEGMGPLVITPLAPGNDLCANATVVTAGVTNFDNTGAATDGPVTPTCGQIDADIWFRYTATAAGDVWVDTCDTTPWDTRIAIYNNNCGALAANFIACNDDSCGSRSRVRFTAVNAAVYLIRVGGSVNRFGTGRLTISAPSATPPHNECAGAFLVVDGPNAVDNLNSTPSAAMPTCFIATNRDTWFRYVAAITGNLDVTTCAGASFDTKLAAHSGGCVGAELACNDDHGAAPSVLCDTGAAATVSRINFPITAGNTYFIRLAGIDMQTGTATLTLNPIANDRCINSGGGFVTAPTVRDGTTPFTTSGAVNDNPVLPIAACGGSITQGLYYRYFATWTGATTFATCGSAFDTKIVVYRAPNFSCADLIAANEVGCSDDNAACGGGSVQSSVNVNTVANEAYIVHVGGTSFPLAAADTKFGTGVLTITPLLPAGPANDNCLTAFVAALGVANPFNTAGANTDGFPDATCAFGANDIFNDVWFVFFPPTAGVYTAHTCNGLTFDTAIAAYAGCPPPTPAGGPVPAHMPIACNDDAPGCGVRSSISFTVAAPPPGQNPASVRIRVGASVAGTTGTGTLTIDGPASAQDACANFIPAVNGAQLFNTAGATTDGPAACAVNQDIWYQYTATRTGRTRISLCGSGYDTSLAVYRSNGGVCPPANQIACNDDNAAACGAASKQSEAIVRVAAGTRYTVRVGGFGAQSGAGLLTITPYCLADINLSGAVSVQDLFDYLAAYFAGNLDVADVNASGAISVQDLFDFLAAYFGPCV